MICTSTVRDTDDRLCLHPTVQLRRWNWYPVGDFLAEPLSLLIWHRLFVRRLFWSRNVSIRLQVGLHSVKRSWKRWEVIPDVSIYTPGKNHWVTNAIARPNDAFSLPPPYEFLAKCVFAPSFLTWPKTFGIYNPGCSLRDQPRTNKPPNCVTVRKPYCMKKNRKTTLLI